MTFPTVPGTSSAVPADASGARARSTISATTKPRRDWGLITFFSLGGVAVLGLIAGIILVATS